MRTLLFRSLLISIFLGLYATAQAADLRPWFGRDRMLYIRPWSTMQWYPSIDTGSGTIHRRTFNQFYGVSATIAKDDTWSLEGETTFSKTSQHSFTLENGSVTLRRKFLNDIVGDPVSLVAGMTLTGPTGRALRDYNTIYHGRSDIEGHLAIGKECSCGAYWDSRWWGAFIIGKADIGDAWFRARGEWEKSYFDQHQCRLFVEGAGGFGHRSLSIQAPFKGYGRVQYRLIDIGASYRFLIDDDGKMLTIEYARRILARNTTKNVNNVSLCVLLPFNL